jgi:hypothetical protein
MERIEDSAEVTPYSTAYVIWGRYLLYLLVPPETLFMYPLSSRSSSR